MSRCKQKNTKPVQAIINHTSTPGVVQKAQQTLGDITNNVLEDDLQNIVVEIRFLALSWLDDFEKELFKGKTVDELLNPSRYD